MSLPSGVKWMPGMYTTCGALCVDVDNHKEPLFLKDWMVAEMCSLALENAKLDLEDPATIGCLEAQVRSIWKIEPLPERFKKCTKGDNGSTAEKNILSLLVGGVYLFGDTKGELYLEAIKLGKADLTPIGSIY